jgi:ribonuclease P protein component
MGRLKLRRLRGQAAFGALLASRQVAASRHLALYSLPAADPKPRLGLVVGKRFAPLAVQRNRIKRILREQCLVEAVPGCNVLVRLRAPLGPGAFSPDFVTEARQLWHTARSALMRAYPNHARLPADDTHRA